MCVCVCVCVRACVCELWNQPRCLWLEQFSILPLELVKKVLSAVQKCIAHDIATTVSRLQPVNRLRESVVRDVMFR